MFCYPLNTGGHRARTYSKKVKYDNFVNSFQLNHVSEEQRNRLI